MGGEDVSKEQLVRELAILTKQVDELKRNQLTRAMKLKLAILDRAPFSIWAADRNLRIVLWSGTCEQIYGLPERDAVGRDYLQLFVDEPEREQSREDCARVIDHDVVFRNFLAYDHSRDGSRRTMLTNCFRIWDEETGQYVQAEIGLEISDLELRKDEHRTLREIGIARMEQARRIFELTRKELIFRLNRALLARRDRIDARIRELEEFKVKITRASGQKQADDITGAELQNLMSKKQRLESDHDELLLGLMQAVNQEQLDQIEGKIVAYESEAI